MRENRAMRDFLGTLTIFEGMRDGGLISVLRPRSKFTAIVLNNSWRETNATYSKKSLRDKKCHF